MAAPMFYLTDSIAGAIAAGANKGSWVVTNHCRLRRVRTMVGTAPATTAILTDVNRNGVSIFAAAGRPSIPAAGTDSGNVAPANGSVVLVPGDRVAWDLDQVGTTTTGSDYGITLELQKL